MSTEHPFQGQSPGPLSGMRVIEFAGIGPAPFAGMMLADMGAEVILIERSADHAALAAATDEMKQHARELRGVVHSAHTARDQKDRQLWFGLGGLLIGILLWSFLPGLVAREIVPASWQWPERMATRVLAETTPWDAGQPLMASASRPSWEAIVAVDRLLRDNREKIEGCRQTARKADQPVRCTIQVGAEK